MIELEHVNFGYPGTPPLFEDFCWRAERGEQWAVIGPSGCGKSTLLMLTAGILRPMQGRVCIDQKPLAGPTPRSGLIFQDHELLPWASVWDNVKLGLNIRSFYGRRWPHDPTELTEHEADARCTTWLKQLQIHEIAERFPGRISGGQRQRAAIARILVTQAERFLMDEPFTALDAPTRESLQELTLELCRDNTMTLLLVTHTIEEAVFMGQRILLLRPTVPISATVIDNPHVPDAAFRRSAAFRQQCNQLREALR